MFSLSIVLDSRITANLIDALTRGAGEGTVSVGSRCPRRDWCGGVTPSNPPLPAMGFAPPALGKKSTRPRFGNVSLAGLWEVPRSRLEV